MKPVGVRISTATVIASSTAKTMNIRPGWRTICEVRAAYQLLSAVKPVVKAAPPRDSHPRQPGLALACAPCGRSTSTQMAGDNVSDTVSEITTVAVMVSANWR